MDPNVIRLLLGETTGDMDLREMYLGIGDNFYFSSKLFSMNFYISASILSTNTR